MVSTASLQRFGEFCGLPTPAERFRANLEVRNGMLMHVLFIFCSSVFIFFQMFWLGGDPSGLQ